MTATTPLAMQLAMQLERLVAQVASLPTVDACRIVQRACAERRAALEQQERRQQDVEAFALMVPGTVLQVSGCLLMGTRDRRVTVVKPCKGGKHVGAWCLGSNGRMTWVKASEVRRGVARVVPGGGKEAT